MQFYHFIILNKRTLAGSFAFAFCMNGPQWAPLSAAGFNLLPSIAKLGDLFYSAVAQIRLLGRAVSQFSTALLGPGWEM